MKRYNAFVYILTNYTKTVLYTGVTNNLPQRIIEHYANKGNYSTFTGRYNCFYLIYFERYKYVNDAIKREKQIKGWARKKKEDVIKLENPDWIFLNNQIMEWPPIDASLRSA